MVLIRSMKFYISVFCIALYCAVPAFAQDGIAYKIKEGYDRMFYKGNDPKIEVAVYNENEYEGYSSSVCCKVESFEGEWIYEFNQRFYVSPADSTILGFSFKVNPGFYRVILEKDGEVLEKAVMGYEPELLGCNKNNPYVINGMFSGNGADTVDLSAVKEIWQGYVDKLNAVPINAEVVKIKKTGGKKRNAYKVTLSSADNVVIEGYYAEPKAKGVYPVVVTCTDKDEELYIPDGNSYEDRIDFVISPRSTGVRNETYYFNICMDVIRAIDFVVQRKEVDLKNIFLQGRGIGGALVMAAAALDDRVTAVTAYAPALSNENVLGKDKIYDVKYLSGELKCPVLMGVGLKDTVCPPYLNFEIYNPIKSVKEYYIFVDGHIPSGLWGELADNFYRKHEQ